MNHWMQILATHHRRMYDRHDGRPLIILFDIDGTILDMRYMIYNVLKRFDEEHGTDHFGGVTVDDIDFHEEHVTGFLDRLKVSRDHQLKVLYRYEPLFLAMAADPYAHVPFSGVFEVIRWFQERPGTVVGLNTGRPETLKKDTLVSLNVLGARKGVAFTEDLLFMKANSWEGTIAALKAEGIRHFREKGYRVCAYIDNEPENLRAVADMAGSEEILLLHADTIFKSDHRVMPGHVVAGNVYDISTLVNLRHDPYHFTDDDGLLKRTA
ncbi:MAG: HAD superfamily, subfamily IIIB (Acid phosphatase) [Syntrophorhabdus sp. PtaB.Bin184]|jgi:phosphoglycolate phosphatase-like HAD superfamily hydrolase|nr:MAG: HAD superfamily, subfamily IIIB (Acid phosphatase) [Syntrophorhabdus sp. PtaB.Bin184]